MTTTPPPRSSLFFAVIAGNLQDVSAWIENSTKRLDKPLDLNFTPDGNDIPVKCIMGDFYYRPKPNRPELKDLDDRVSQVLEHTNLASKTPYLMAILCGRIEMIRLFEKSNEAGQIELDLSSPIDALSCAVQSGHVQTVQLFVSRIEDHFDVNQRDRDGDLLILSATKNARYQENKENNPFVKTLQLVLDLKDLRMNETDSFRGRTALHHAAASGDEFVAKMLLDHGANVNQLDDTGWTALHVAAESIGYDHCSHDFFRVMLEHPGANANQTVVQQSAVLDKHWASLLGESPLHFLLKDAYAPDVIPIFIQHGADVNQGDRNGLTPLHYALETSREATAHFLATESLLLDQIDNNGNSYLVAVAGNFTQKHGFDEKTEYGVLAAVDSDNGGYGRRCGGHEGQDESSTHNLSALLADTRVARPVAALAAAVSACNIDAVMILLHCCIGRDILHQWFHQQRWMQKITLYKHAVSFFSKMPEKYQQQHQEIVNFNLCRLNTAHALDSESALRVFNNQWPALVADRIETFVHSNRYVRRTLEQVKKHFLSTINYLFKVMPTTTTTTTTTKVAARTVHEDIDERLTILQRACFATTPSHFQVEAIRFLLEFDEIEVNKLCILIKDGNVVRQTALSIAVDALEKMVGSPPDKLSDTFSDNWRLAKWQKYKNHLDQIIQAIENAGGIVHVEE